MENSDTLFQYCSVFLEKEHASSSLSNTSVGNPITIPNFLTKSSTKEINNQLEEYLNEEHCSDCGQKLFSQSYQIESLCQSPTPTAPSSSNLQLSMDYRESTQPQQPPSDSSTSDYDSSSEFGSSYNLKDSTRDFDDSNSDLDSSYDSLPPMNCSFTDVM